MKYLFLYFLAATCSSALLIASPKIEKGERSQTETVENIDEILSQQKERALKIAELIEQGGEEGLAAIMATPPAEENISANVMKGGAISNHSRVGNDAGLINQMEVAGGYSIIEYPGAFHPVMQFYKKEAGLLDGSWWKIYRGDLRDTYNWVTNDSLSLVDIALGLVADTVVITPNGDWPLFSDYRYHLTNQRTDEFVQANISDYSKGFNSRTIIKNSWRYDSFGNLFAQLTLDDGSVWNTLPADSHSLYWNYGDIIVVGVNTDQYAAFVPYMLIKVKKNHGKCTTENCGAACVLYFR